MKEISLRETHIPKDAFQECFQTGRNAAIDV
jgi:hypothetical protein